MSENFKVIRYYAKGEPGMVYRTNIIEPAEAVDAAEDWLAQYGTAEKSYCDIVFNGGDEVHARVFLLAGDSLGILNTPEARWPVYYPDSDDGNIMLSGDPWPDQGDFKPWGEGGKGQHKKDEKSDKMKLDGEDNGDEDEDDGFQEDEDADDEAYEEDDEGDTEIEDDEGDDDEDGDIEDDEDDEDDSDDFTDDDDDGEADSGDDGDDAEADADEGAEDEEDENEEESEDEGEAEDADDENDEDESDADPQDEAEGSEEDDEDGDEVEAEMPRLNIFAKMKGPLGWRKRAVTEELNERNAFAFKIGVLDAEGEKPAAQEAEVFLHAEFIETDADREGGVFRLKLPDGITPEDFTQTKSGWMTVRVPYRAKD